MIKRIHINRNAILANRKSIAAGGGAVEPPISVKVGKRNIRCDTVEIAGPSRVVYSPGKPLSCGAVLWVETRGRISTMNTTGLGEGVNFEMQLIP